MKAAAFDFLQPDSISGALQLLGTSAVAARVLGGGQSLGPMLNLRLAQPELLIGIGRLQEIRTASLEANAVTLGAGVTHASIEDRLVPDVTLGLMPFVASNIAYRAIRNRGTLGGSLAHADPAADWVSTMLLVGATMLIAGASGCREVLAREFIKGPFTTALGEEEILTAIRIPKFSPSARWGYYKFCRKTGEFAEAIGAALYDPERGICRLLIGATDGAPTLVDDAQSLLKDAAPAAINRILEDAGLGDDSYALKMHRIAAVRAIAMLNQTDSLKR